MEVGLDDSGQPAPLANETDTQVCGNGVVICNAMGKMVISNRMQKINFDKSHIPLNKDLGTLVFVPLLTK